MELLSQHYVHGVKLIVYFTISFVIAMLVAPALINLLTRFEWWKKKTKDVASTGEKLVVVKKLYDKVEGDRKLPASGGVLIWGVTLIIAGFFWFLLRVLPASWQNPVNLTQFLNFVDWRQTFIPLGVMIGGAVLGLLDDYLVTRAKESSFGYFAGGLKLSHRMIGVVGMSAFIGWWFHARIGDFMHKITLPWWTGDGWFVLDLTTLRLPFEWLDQLTSSIGINWNLSNGGWLIIPITIIVLTSLWSTAIIDGFDGLSTGTLIPVYLAFTGLAFVGGFYDIATLMAVMSGAMVAYLWYNIPPARFYLGDTGSTPLLLVLGTVAMLIDKLFVLPIAGFLLFVTMFSAIIQIASKKFFKRKVFLAAPLHHHLEASGWLRHQVTMRYWLISIVTSALGFAVGVALSSSLFR